MSRTITHRDPVAKSLQNRQFHQRIVKNKKKHILDTLRRKDAEYDQGS